LGQGGGDWAFRWQQGHLHRPGRQVQHVILHRPFSRSEHDDKGHLRRLLFIEPALPELIDLVVERRALHEPNAAGNEDDGDQVRVSDDAIHWRKDVVQHWELLKPLAFEERKHAGGDRLVLRRRPMLERKAPGV
jgi:hypothetical protein